MFTTGYYAAGCFAPRYFARNPVGAAAYFPAGCFAPGYFAGRYFPHGGQRGAYFPVGHFAPDYYAGRYFPHPPAGGGAGSGNGSELMHL